MLTFIQAAFCGGAGFIALSAQHFRYESYQRTGYHKDDSCDHVGGYGFPQNYEGENRRQRGFNIEDKRSGRGVCSLHGEKVKSITKPCHKDADKYKEGQTPQIDAGCDWNVREILKPRAGEQRRGGVYFRNEDKQKHFKAAGNEAEAGKGDASVFFAASASRHAVKGESDGGKQRQRDARRACRHVERVHNNDYTGGAHKH